MKYKIIIGMRVIFELVKLVISQKRKICERNKKILIIQISFQFKLPNSILFPVIPVICVFKIFVFFFNYTQCYTLLQNSDSL